MITRASLWSDSLLLLRVPAEGSAFVWSEHG